MVITDIMKPVDEVVYGGFPLDQTIRIMERLKVESLPVIDHNRFIGILTKHDIELRSKTKEWDPTRLLVRNVITRREITCSDSHSLQEVFQLLEHMNETCLMVLNRQGQPLGLVYKEDIYSGLLQESCHSS
ncbi:CBS domain-containing protein [Candidatus Nitrospira salsa]